MRARASCVWLMCVLALPALGQSSSIARRRARDAVRSSSTLANPRIPDSHKGNRTLEKHSLTAVKLKEPREFSVHDLITIIVREQRKYESEAELETKKKFNIKSTLNALFEPVNGTLGAAAFSNGKPNVDFKFNSNIKNESDMDREDRFTTRITAEIVDIKPNDNLVLQARARIQYEDEVSIVTLTGVVRSVDVTPDNTVLSTQLAQKNITVENAGAVRDGSRRGWIPRLLDWLRPI